ncbi:YqaJ viral recombinase family protein [Cryobacterium sp. 1639]|uniref:YqaJ viral recombinase family protein n=1 Tax=Cryobacterium inferilacus TaxID=2866629 RepID=UPI001C734743|nr:YqaJ viral recombinase family protein [Cryobacterium sp. 1639]
MDAIRHANVEDQWALVGELIDAALNSSPIASTRTPALPLVRRAARWGALALITRHFRDELAWGNADYAILTLPWTWSLGALHPADLAEDPWSDFSGARLDLPVKNPPVLVSARLPDPAVLALQPVEHGLFHVRYWLGDDGNPVGSDDDEDRWLAARRTGVGASEVGKIVKANGAPSVQRAGLLQRKLDGDPGHHFAAYDHGVEREPIIARWVNDNFAIAHNAHLCMGQNPRHLATPDGIGDGVICEIKTSVVPLAKAVRRYRDQLQWQLHVTSSPQVLFVVENRDTLEREYTWVGRDEDRIATLVAHTNDFLVELDMRLEERESHLRPIAAKRVVRFEESSSDDRREVAYPA